MEKRFYRSNTPAQEASNTSTQRTIRARLDSPRTCPARDGWRGAESGKPRMRGVQSGQGASDFAAFLPCPSVALVAEETLTGQAGPGGYRDGSQGQQHPHG